MSRTLLLNQFFIITLAWFVSSVSAQEFSIETQVYSGQSTQPISHNITLFTPKLVCDTRMSNEAEPKPIEYVLFDPRQKLIVLLDTQREVLVELRDLELLNLMEGLRRETMQNEHTKFLTNDTFEEETDWSDGWVTLTSPNITYRFKGRQPEDVSFLPPYFDFLDHFTRLKASDPAMVPPFPRIRLNQSIKKLGWIPDEVQIEIRRNALFREPIEATTKHVLTSGLSSNDQEMIAQARKLWMQYEAVPLTEYRGIEKKSIIGAIKKHRELNASAKDKLGQQSDGIRRF